MSLATWFFRINCKKSDAKRDKGLIKPDDIKCVCDISYGPDKKWQVLDVYRPKETIDKLPVIVSVHGGGFVYGDKETYRFYCMDLAQRGFAVINFSYRLAPENKFPAPLEDTNQVFHWIYQHGKEYGLDLDRLFVVGDSAGATTAGLYAAMLTNPDYGSQFSISLPDVTIRAMGLNCGIYQVCPGERKFFQTEIFEKKGIAQELDQISLMDHVTSQFPPCYLLGAYQDALKQEISGFQNKLQSLGVTCESKIYGDEKHPLYHVFHCNIRSEAARIANDAECDFFRRMM